MLEILQHLIDTKCYHLEDMKVLYEEQDFNTKTKNKSVEATLCAFKKKKIKT